MSDISIDAGVDGKPFTARGLLPGCDALRRSSRDRMRGARQNRKEDDDPSNRAELERQIAGQSPAERDGCCREESEDGAGRHASPDVVQRDWRGTFPVSIVKRASIGVAITRSRRIGEPPPFGRNWLRRLTLLQDGASIESRPARARQPSG